MCTSSQRQSQSFSEIYLKPFVVAVVQGNHRVDRMSHLIKRSWMRSGAMNSGYVKIEAHARTLVGIL